MSENLTPPDADPGLRKMLTWTAIALVAAVLFGAVVVVITVRLFGG